ncbi:MAG TPA: hypothetical protein VHV29_04875 [Terriglobales bacterium]|nr:hypothetical protein [Terriglobales bacterium]
MDNIGMTGHLIDDNKPAFLTNPAHVFVAPVCWPGKYSANAPLAGH